MMTVKHRAFVVGSYRLVQFWVYFSGRIFFVFGQKATTAYRYALINVFINLKLFNIWKTLITRIKEGREDTINHHQYTWYSISKQFCFVMYFNSRCAVPSLSQEPSNLPLNSQRNIQINLRQWDLSPKCFIQMVSINILSLRYLLMLK